MSSAVLLLDELVRLGATPNPPATPAAIDATELRLGIRFPQGIAEFYRLCDGLATPTTECIWNFFPLHEVARLSGYRSRPGDHLKMDDSTAGPPLHSLVIFCDALIDAPLYSYCVEDTSRVFGSFFAELCGGWHVADSFEHFVEVFLAHNDDGLIGV